MTPVADGGSILHKSALNSLLLILKISRSFRNYQKVFRLMSYEAEDPLERIELKKSVKLDQIK